jgi:hypothetical protein
MTPNVSRRIKTAFAEKNKLTFITVLGFVTDLKIGRYETLDSIGSNSDDYSLSPLTKSIVSSFAVIGCGKKMAAGVEGVVDGGIN